MKQVTFTIGIGHDNPPNGQTGTSGELELLKKVYFALAPLLIKAGIVVYYDDATVNNAKTTDYALFPHFDGSTKPEYDGGFVDCSPTSATKDKDWKFAGVIANYYFSSMGIRFAPEHRSINSTNYYAFNYTGENTIQALIELGTLTNASDKAKCQDYNKIATLLANGIIAYLKANDTTYQAYLAGTVTQPVPPTIPSETEIDRLRKELQEQKELVKTLQTEKKGLADSLTKCKFESSTLTDRIDRIKDYIETA